MTPKLYKVAEVCEIGQLQPYVLRSWEKEFPGIGIQKAEDTPRLYRQSDLDHVLRIKQLVFGEGLTLAGARRRLEESAPSTPATEVAEVIEVLGADARKRIGRVRDGLRSLLHMLDGGDEYPLSASPAPAKTARARAVAQRGKTPSRVKTVIARGKSSTTTRGKATKRKRASA